MKFLLISFFLSASFCSSYAQESHILIISGGGFTGSATVYKIGLDRKVLKGKGLGEIIYTEESKLKKCLVKKYFKRVRALQESTPDFIHPGNLYSSITLYENGKESRITWGDTEHAVPDDVKKLYKKINASLTKLTFIPNARK